MKTLTPFGVLLIFSIIGLLTHKFGLWFPLGVVAFIVTAVIQNRRSATPPAAEDEPAND